MQSHHENDCKPVHSITPRSDSRPDCDIECIKPHLALESPVQLLCGFHLESNMFVCNVNPVVRQVVAALSASMVMFALMSIWAFPAIALPQMALPGSPINFSTEQASWFASLPFLMCIPGNLLAGPLCEWAGPRRLMLALTPLLSGITALMGAASWQVVYEAVPPELFLLVARILQASLQALLLPVVLIYIYEVCDARLRGTMIPIQDCWASSAFPICYLAGCFLDWPVVTSLMSLVTFVLAFFGLLVSPESPAWLFKKRKDDAGHRNLTQLRCSEEEISEEMAVIKKNSQDDPGCWTTLLLLKKRSNALAMTVSVILLVFKELSGIAVLSVFTVKIFELAGVGVDPCWSSVIVGLAQVVFKGVASIILHYSPRKPLLVVGNLISAAGMASLGAFFFMQSSGMDVVVSWLWWLPLLSAFVFMIGYAGALGPASWTVAMEVLPGSVRSLGFSFGSAFYAAAALTVSKTFENGEPAIALYGVFFLYATSAIVYLIFVLIFVIETRGQSLRDIEEYWESFDI